MPYLVKRKFHLGGDTHTMGVVHDEVTALWNMREHEEHHAELMESCRRQGFNPSPHRATFWYEWVPMTLYRVWGFNHHLQYVDSEGTHGSRVSAQRRIRKLEEFTARGRDLLRDVDCDETEDDHYCNPNAYRYTYWIEEEIY